MPHGAGVAGEDLHQLAARDIEEPGDLVIAPGEQVFAVRRESHRVNPVRKNPSNAPGRLTRGDI